MSAPPELGVEETRSEPVLSLVFVHGFQGDHTSFQSFPTDLHSSLLPRIPTLQTWVYPTYKARRSVEHATDELLKWMKSTLPPGPVILLGHSMGGILIVEAAFREEDGGERVIGLINFDVPFLGVHPHVVVSGLASLFKHKDDKPEHEMNDPNTINLPHSETPSPNLSPSTSVSTIPSSSSSSTLAPPPSLHLSQPSPPHPANELLNFAFQTLKLGPPPESLTSKIHWLSKHRKAPFSGAWKHVSETMEFASCLMDPAGLWGRYQLLVRWGGGRWKGREKEAERMWVNYWTETVPRVKPPPPEEGKEPGTEEGEAKEVKEGEEEEEEDEEGYVTADEGADEAGQNAVKSETMAGALLLGGIAEPSASTSTLGSMSSTSLPETGSRQSSMEPPESEATAVQEAPVPEEKEKTDTTDAPTPSADPSGEEPPDTVSKPEQATTPDRELTPEERKAQEKAAKQAQKEAERAEKAAAKERAQAEKAERKAREAEQRAAQKEAERVLRETKKAQQAALKEAEAKAKAAAKAAKPGEAYHFIVLPFGYKDSKEWIRVRVAGVESEVEAHCGIFFREENGEYDWLVADVAEKVMSCWEAAGGR